MEVWSGIVWSDLKRDLKAFGILTVCLLKIEEKTFSIEESNQQASEKRWRSACHGLEAWTILLAMKE